MEGENLAEALERFHELLRRCLHHRLTRWMQVHTFYNGLSDPTRTVIDASARGALMKNTTDQAYDSLEDMATNNNQWPKDKLVARKKIGGTDLDVFKNLASQVSLLTKQLQKQQGAMDAIQTNTTVWNVSQDRRLWSRHNLWLDITTSSITHMDEIVSRTRGGDGGIIKTMDGEIIKIICCHPKGTNNHRKRR